MQPGVKCTIKDDGAYGLITVQGSGRIGNMAISSPVMIRFGQMTEDELFVSHEAAVRGVTFENTGFEPLVTLRYFGPEVCARRTERRRPSEEPVGRREGGRSATLTLLSAVCHAEREW